MHETEPGSVSAALIARLREDIAQAGGWIPFDRFMHAALYTPGLGYYARGDSPIGLMPSGSPGAGPNGATGSDFVTAPVLSPFFGRALAAQVAQALRAAQADEVFDTSLIYEPSVLKVYAERYLLEVPASSPAYPTAFRLRRLIDRFVAIDAAHVPPTSILREFIGDSGFVY